MNDTPNETQPQAPSSQGGRGGAIALLVIGVLLDLFGILAIVVTFGDLHIVNEAELGTARIIGGALIAIGSVIEAVGLMKFLKRSGH